MTIWPEKIKIFSQGKKLIIYYFLPFEKPEAGRSDDCPKFKRYSDPFKCGIDKELNGKTMLLDWPTCSYLALNQRYRKIINGLIWHKISIDEMHVFLDLNMVMEVVKMLHQYMYWSNHIQFGGPEVFHNRIISHNRWHSIMTFFEVRPSTGSKYQQSKVTHQAFLGGSTQEMKGSSRACSAYGHLQALIILVRKIIL